VPLLQAGDIVDGVVDQHSPRMIDAAVHRRHRRTSLVAGDLVVVLVGRIGDTAVVGPAQHGWNAARSVGIVRFNEAGQHHGISTWLHWWMKTPKARALCAESSAGSAHSTLAIATLTQLPVPLPPLDFRTHLLRTMHLVERRMALNTRIIACAMELADAHFAGVAHENEGVTGPDTAIADVGEVITGTRRSDVMEGGVPVAWAAPAEVLRHRLADLDRTDQVTWASPGAVCAPGALLVAPRPGGVETVVSRIPVIPGRGMLAIRTAREADRMWLLHELRSRSQALVSTAQGQQGREMSLKAFSRFTVSWPDSTEVRERFARLAVPLHARAHAALEENRVLEALIITELTDMAEKTEGRG
jgi:type I restriction enzyme S subunit